MVFEEFLFYQISPTISILILALLMPILFLRFREEDFTTLKTAKRAFLFSMATIQM